MESQMAHPSQHPRNYDEGTHNAGLHSVIEGDDGQQHEKQSVIKKVKAKAKKIKDKLTPHGHGHGHERDHEEEEDDDEDEEIVQDPEVHGAPIYESAAVRSAVSRPDVNLGQPAGGNNLERPPVQMAEDRNNGRSRPGVNYSERPSVKAEDHRHDDSHTFDPPVRPFGQWQEEKSGLGRPTTMAQEFHAPVDKHLSHNHGVHGHDVNIEQSRGKFREGKGMEEDPNAPKNGPGASAPSNYESKVTDPTGQGGKEAGITSILHSLDKMGIYDDSETKSNTGAHDQSSHEAVPKSFNPDRPEELPRDALTGNPSDQSSYTEKISSATSAIAGKAVAAKDVIASKLGYTGSHEDAGKSASPTEYAHMIAATVTEKLAPVYGKVADAGSSVISKVHGTAGKGQAQEKLQGAIGTGEEGRTSVGKGPDKGVSVTTYLSEKLRPGDEDKVLSEVITHAFRRGDREAEGGRERPISVVVSDALHKSGSEEVVGDQGRQIPMGKVTESEEVARRLSSGEEEHSQGNVSAEKGVVDRLKGAVDSWIGRGGERQSATGTRVVTEEGLSSASGAEEESARSDMEPRLS